MPEHPTSATDQPVINALIQLDPRTKKFEAGGHTYFVEDALSIERYKHFQRLELELGYSLSFADLHSKIKQAYEAANEQRFADTAVLLYTLLEGSVAISEKTPIALYVATLFINRTDEDRGAWSRALAEEKLADWKNIDTAFFLIVALGKVRGYSESLRDVSRMLEQTGPTKPTTENPGDNLPSTIG